MPATDSCASSPWKTSTVISVNLPFLRSSCSERLDVQNMHIYALAAVNERPVVLVIDGAPRILFEELHQAVSVIPTGTTNLWTHGDINRGLPLQTATPKNESRTYAHWKVAENKEMQKELNKNQENATVQCPSFLLCEFVRNIDSPQVFISNDCVALVYWKSLPTDAEMLFLWCSKWDCVCQGHGTMIRTVCRYAAGCSRTQLNIRRCLFRCHQKFAS